MNDIKINKDLLQQILGFKIDYIIETNPNYISIHSEMGGESFNRHLLTFKAKEYLYSQEYEAFSGPMIDDNDEKIYICELYRMYGTKETYIIDEVFEAEDELQAVLKACEWIKYDI